MVNEQVTTVTLTGTPQEIKFASAYPYIWVDNKSASDVYAAIGRTPEADKDGTYTIAAGSQLRISCGAYNSGVTLLGNGKVQVIASGIATSPFVPVKKGGDKAPTLLPKPIGLTAFFSYENGIDTVNNTWSDMVDGIVSAADGVFGLTEDYITMDGTAFSLGFGAGLSAHTIYGIVCAADYASGWTSLIASYGSTPQFNACSANGKLGIGSGSTYGRYIGTVPSYGEWHVCCITADEGYGAFYIDGNMVYSYNGYSKPQYTDAQPLCFGYGNIKMLAVCANIAHGADLVKENSEYLKAAYIT